MIQIFYKAFFIDKNAYWFGVTNPPFLAWVLGFVSYIRSKPFLFMFLDLHPEGIIALEKFKKNSYISKLWIFLNKKSYQRAGKVIVLGRDMIKILKNNYNLKEENIFYCPHWSSKSPNNPISFKNSLYTKKWNLKNQFIIQYSGNMGLWHDIDTIVFAANILKNNKNLKFLMIGDGIRKKKALELSKTLNLKNIEWRDFVSFDDLEESLAACHIALISLKKNLEGVAVPSKLYGILASGRPVLAQVPKNSEVCLTIQQHKCGIHVNTNDPTDLAQKIKKLSNDKGLSELGKNSFLAYKKFYTIDSAFKKLEKIILN